MSPLLFTSCSADYPLELPHLSCFHLRSVLTCLSLCNQSCVSTYNPPFTFIKTSVFPPCFTCSQCLDTPCLVQWLQWTLFFFSDFCQLRHFFFIVIPPNSRFCTLFTSVQDNKGFNCGRCKSKSMINTTYQSFTLLTFVRSFSHISWTAVAFSQ